MVFREPVKETRMLRLFGESRKIVFFPKSWANAVTRWILTLCSRSGTITFSNRKGDEGTSIDVDAERLAAAGESALAKRFVSRTTSSGVDGESIELDGSGRLRVNAEWLDRFVRRRIVTGSQVGTSA